MFKENSQVTDLSTSLTNHVYKNPIFLGSGSIDDSFEKVNWLLNSEVGAVIPRTTRLHITPGRERHPSPHLDINLKTQSMRNAEWTGNTIDYWREYLPELATTERVIMSVSGRHIDDCVTVCKELDQHQFPLLEINISCPQSNEASGFIMKSSDHIRRVVTSIKEAGVVTPISLKLGHSDFIVHLAQVAEAAGVDAITAINTVGPVLDFDITKGEPRLTLGISGGKGGLSGKTIFPIALTDVAELSKYLHIPVIGCGGVSTAEDVIKMIMAGASAVEIYTAAHLHGNKAPQFIDSLIRNVQHWLVEHHHPSTQSIRGAVLPLFNSPHQMEPRIPKIKDGSCIDCGKCENICLEEGAIRVTDDGYKKLVVIEPSLCIGCGACVTICPREALDYK
jgi:dihydroorotate dehydrogenase subfamily 1